MPTLKLHYEGWVSLPTALRQQLGLNSGDRLEVDLVDGTIVLRPAATTKRSPPREDQAVAIDSPAPDAPETLTLTDAVPARRKPGRPRKHEAAAEVVAPTPKRPRGRPRAVRAPEAEPAPVRAASSEPWKLRRKQDLQPQTANVEHAPLPSPILIGPEARWRRRWKSAVRFATSKCASLARDASTTGLGHFPGAHLPT